MEPLKHECGVAMVRLRKPLDYYKEKYGTTAYGPGKLYLLMEKQHNRGQEGAGLAGVCLKASPGEEYMYRERGLGSSAITEIFQKVSPQITQCELLMGHLRYSTTGKSGLSYVHPFLRRNNWRARNLCLCGNFNMTNMAEVFEHLTANGQHPRVYADTYLMLEQVGHRLDRESERLWQEAQQRGLQGMEITRYIEDHIDVCNVLRTAAPQWDGGYVVCGLTGSGESFAMRDPWGIRPAFYYVDDEVMVLASERPVIQTAFNLEVDDVHELLPGQALVVNRRAEVRLEQIVPAKRLQACSFERIYFSRGSDSDIYRERKALGRQLYAPVLRAINNEVADTVFSFIPNTAETAYYGLCEEFESNHPRVRREKVVHKDIKLRTFITESDSRGDLAAHVYDITYGSLRPYEDNLVVIDDSIVRGTTLRESIIRILDRLHPKRLVLVSSAPQVRYPDYYGIDMANLSEFIAFRAAVALLMERGGARVLTEVYDLCIAQRQLAATEMQNYVSRIYAPFTDEEISRKMVDMLRAPGVETDIHIVFQSVEGLHKAIPNHPGDWYFSGQYPTPGGLRQLNEAYIRYYEGRNM